MARRERENEQRNWRIEIPARNRWTETSVPSLKEVEMQKIGILIAKLEEENNKLKQIKRKCINTCINR